MRVLQFGSIPPRVGGQTVGGVCVHLWDLSTNLAAQGHDVHVLAHNLLDPPGTPFERDGVTVWAPSKLALATTAPRLLRPSRARSLRQWFAGLSPQTALKYSVFHAFADRVIDTVCPDVIHTHHINQLYPICRLADPQTPIVSTAHSFNHVAPGNRHLVERAYAETEYAIWVSDSVRREATQEFGAFDGHDWHIPNPANIDRFRPMDTATARDRLGVDTDRPVVGAAGTIAESKGIFALIDAVARLRDRDREVTLLVAGDGPATDRLHATIDRNDLTDSVHYLGHVDAMQAFYNALDLFALPSHYESFGLVYLEAMACGTPVIGTTEMPDGVIDPQTAGARIAPGDHSELAAQIDAGLAGDWDASAIRDHAKTFSWDDWIGDFEDIYATAVA